MPNKFRGEVEIEIGGSVRKMRFDMNALAELETRLQMPVSKIFDEEHVGIRVLRECLHVGLQAFNKRLTLQDVGSWMSGDNLKQITEAITQGISLAMGDDKEEDDTAPLAVVAVADGQGG